jgi:hypothetical protein
MTDRPVMIYCHWHNNWTGPTTTSDGLKYRCSICKKNIPVIRYVAQHPRSPIAQRGGNTRPVTSQEIAPVNTALPVSNDYVTPVSVPRRNTPPKTVSGTVVSSAIPMVTDIAKAVTESRKPRIDNTREPGPYDAHTPGMIGFCEECQDGNYRPNGTFEIAEYEVTLIISNQPIAKRLCGQHTQAHHIGFIMPRPSKILALRQAPPPRYNIRQTA